MRRLEIRAAIANFAMTWMGGTDLVEKEARGCQEHAYNAYGYAAEPEKALLG